MAGLRLEEFLSPKPGPVQELHPDYYNMLGGIGEAIGASRRAQEQRDLQQQQLDREVQRDTRNDSRERVGQEQRAREMLMSDKRAGQREELYSRQENRREAAALREEDGKHQAEVEELFRGFQQATINRDPAAIHYYKDALERHGISSEEVAHVPPPAPAGAGAQGGASAPQNYGNSDWARAYMQGGPAPARAPLPGQQTHLSKPAASALSADLAAQQHRILSGIGEDDSAAPGADSGATAPPARYVPRYLPGQPILGADDTYNNIK